MDGSGSGPSKRKSTPKGSELDIELDAVPKRTRNTDQEAAANQIQANLASQYPSLNTILTPGNVIDVINEGDGSIVSRVDRIEQANGLILRELRALSENTNYMREEFAELKTRVNNGDAILSNLNQMATYCWQQMMTSTREAPVLPIDQLPFSEREKLEMFERGVSTAAIDAIETSFSSASLADADEYVDFAKGNIISENEVNQIDGRALFSDGSTNLDPDEYEEIEIDGRRISKLKVIEVGGGISRSKALLAFNVTEDDEVQKRSKIDEEILDSHQSSNPRENFSENHLLRTVRPDERIVVQKLADVSNGSQLSEKLFKLDRFAQFWQQVKPEADTISDFNPPMGASGLKATFNHLKEKCGFRGEDPDLISSNEYKTLMKVLKNSPTYTFKYGDGKSKKVDCYEVVFTPNFKLKTNKSHAWGFKCEYPNCWIYSLDIHKQGRCLQHCRPDEIVGTVALVSDKKNTQKIAGYLRFVPRKEKDLIQFFKRELVSKPKGKPVAAIAYVKDHDSYDFCNILYEAKVTNSAKDVYLHTLSIGLEILSLFQHKENKKIKMLSSAFRIEHINFPLLKKILEINGVPFSIGERSEVGLRAKSPMVDWPLVTSDLPFEYIAFCQPGAVYNGECLFDRREGKFRSETHKRKAAKLNDNMSRQLLCDEDDIKSEPIWQMFDVRVDDFKDEKLDEDEKAILQNALDSLRNRNRNWYKVLSQANTDKLKQKLINKMKEKVKREESITILVKVIGQMLGLHIDSHPILNKNKKYSCTLTELSESERDSFEKKFEFLYGFKVVAAESRIVALNVWPV